MLPLRRGCSMVVVRLSVNSCARRRLCLSLLVVFHVLWEFVSFVMLNSTMSAHLKMPLCILRHGEQGRPRFHPSLLELEETGVTPLYFYYRSARSFGSSCCFSSPWAVCGNELIGSCRPFSPSRNKVYLDDDLAIHFYLIFKSNIPGPRIQTRYKAHSHIKLECARSYRGGDSESVSPFTIDR